MEAALSWWVSFLNCMLAFPFSLSGMALRKPSLLPFTSSKGRKGLYLKMTSFLKSQLCNSFPSARLLPGHCWGLWRVAASISPLWQWARGTTADGSGVGRRGRQSLQPLLSCGDAVVWERQACSLPRRVAITEEGRVGGSQVFPHSFFPWLSGSMGKQTFLMAGLAGYASSADQSDKPMEAADI